MSERKKPPSPEKKKARRNYEILETIEAGMVLMGTEVKSLRQGRAELSDAYVIAKDAELYLINLRIEPYESAGAFGHEETRTRKLLLHRNEILKLISKIREKQLTVIPLKMYFNDRGVVKVLLGVGKGKKTVDRREDEKKSQAKKEMERAMKEANRRKW